jgi:hypothetical protein
VILYEVRIEIDAVLADAYRTWLDAHVREIVALPGFAGAAVFAEDATTTGRAGFCIHYRLVDRAALDRYLMEHAPRMRAEGTARFGDRFSARRRVLDQLATYPGV